MWENILERVRDLLPLLIFILFPILGRLGSALAKRAKAQEREAGGAPGRPTPRAQAAANRRGDGVFGQGGALSFLEVQQEEDSAAESVVSMELGELGELGEPAEVEAYKPWQDPQGPSLQQASHDRERESLKQHLSHRDQLSMDDLKPILDIASAAGRSIPKDRGQRLVSSSRTSDAAWFDAAPQRDMAVEVLDPTYLRQAMLWHEVLSKPLAMRDREEFA